MGKSVKEIIEGEHGTDVDDYKNEVRIRNTKNISNYIISFDD